MYFVVSMGKVVNTMNDRKLYKHKCGVDHAFLTKYINKIVGVYIDLFSSTMLYRGVFT